MFQLRYSYNKIFHEPNFAVKKEDDEEDDGENIDATKMFKISYKINVLPMIDEHVIYDSKGNKHFVN